MYAPAIEELVTPWPELEAEFDREAGSCDPAAELLVDEFDIWTLTDTVGDGIKLSLCGGCGTFAPLDEALLGKDS